MTGVETERREEENQQQPKIEETAATSFVEETDDLGIEFLLQQE